MNKIRVIDLLNKIAKGEEVPKKFTYNGYLWEYDIKNKMWFYYFGEGKNHRFDRLFYLNMLLNDEVEVIEEKEIENIPFDNEMPLTMMEMYHQLEKYNYKINQIIDVMNDMRDKE